MFDSKDARETTTDRDTYSFLGMSGDTLLNFEFAGWYFLAVVISLGMGLLMWCAIDLIQKDLENHFRK